MCSEEYVISRNPCLTLSCLTVYNWYIPCSLIQKFLLSGQSSKLMQCVLSQVLLKENDSDENVALSNFVFILTFSVSL